MSKLWGFVLLKAKVWCFTHWHFVQGFKIKTATDGIYFSPIHEGKVLNEEEFNKLDEETKKKFKTKSPKIQQETMGIMKQLDVLEKECYEKVNAWQSNIISYIVSKNINDLKIK